MEARELRADRDLERAGGLARRRARGARGGAPLDGDPPVLLDRVPLPAVVLVVHRVAEDVVDRHVVRAPIEARAAARPAVVPRDELIVALEEREIVRGELLAGGVEILVDLLEVLDGDDESADV